MTEIRLRLIATWGDGPEFLRAETSLGGLAGDERYFRLLVSELAREMAAGLVERGLLPPKSVTPLPAEARP